MDTPSSRWKRQPTDQRGAAAVIVALFLVLMLGSAALAVDLGMLLDARAEAQRAADAAALAGASAFVPPPVPRALMEDTARARALAYAQLNPIRRQPAAPEDVTVTVDLDSSIVRVSLRRRGMATWFARIFGTETLEVSARAAAWAATSGRAACLKPFIIIDAWDDRNGNRLFDAGDFYAADSTGWGSTFRNNDGSGFVNDVGRPVTLKRGQTDVATQTGWYQLVRIGDNKGGSDIRNEIRSTVCNPAVVEVGTSLPGEWGATVGPVLQGVEDLIALDPNAQWFNGAIVGSAYGFGGNGANSPRIINVPLMDPSIPVTSQQKDFVVTNIAAIFLENVDRTGAEADRRIYGRWMTLRGIPDNCRERNNCRPTLRYLRLIE